MLNTRNSWLVNSLRAKSVQFFEIAVSRGTGTRYSCEYLRCSSPWVSPFTHNAGLLQHPGYHSSPHSFPRGPIIDLRERKDEHCVMGCASTEWFGIRTLALGFIAKRPNQRATRSCRTEKFVVTVHMTGILVRLSEREGYRGSHMSPVTVPNAPDYF